MPSSRIAAMYDLTGQVALVTGASAGLGDRFARLLAEAGAKVAVAARRRDKLEQLVSDIRATGSEAHAIALDVAEVERFPHAIDEIEAALGRVTILVNNAGIPDGRRAAKIPLELTNRLLDVNLRGPWVLCQEVGRRLIDANMPGRIVNISSTAAYAYHPRTFASLYAVTKAAISRMTEVLAMEWAGNHINVNAIAPGFFVSEMTDGFLGRLGGEEAVEKFLNSMPRKRMARPEQLDTTLLYLVSPASDCVTGTCILVDDGQTSR